MKSSLFNELDKMSYEKYLMLYPFHEKLGIKLAEYKENLNKAGDKKSRVKRGGGISGKTRKHFGLKQKIDKSLWGSVDPENTIPFAAELDDLIRLHFLITSRKVTTILEFGVGQSTWVFDHALSFNKLKYEEFVLKNLRRSNPFECHSIDNSKKWINLCKNSFQTENVFYHLSKCRMGLFQNRICTYYDSIPNVSPDLIYLDAPDQHSIIGEINGVSTRHKDRMPMAGDILRIEHFLLPGTLIVVDGRTANARFLKCNLQRNWDYVYLEEFDQHFFELVEKPLGRYNKLQLEFTRNK